MHRYWASGFPPASLRETVTTAWPWSPLVQLFSNGGGGFSTSLGYPWPAASAALALVGLALLVRRAPATGLTLALPLLATVAAALLRQYPFRDRVILFLVPILFLGFGEAATAAYAGLARLRHEVGVVAVAVLTAGVAYPVLRVHPPYPFEDVHPIMAAVAQDRPNAPAIFLHYNAAAAFEYYAPRYGFNPSDYSVASCRVSRPSAILREVDSALRGRRRAWVLFVHLTPSLAIERTDLLAYLDTIGRRLNTISVPGGRAVGAPVPSEAFLYDLSDPNLLARANAETFPLKATFDRGANCFEGPQAMSVPKLAVGR